MGDSGVTHVEIVVEELQALDGQIQKLLSEDLKAQLLDKPSSPSVTGETSTPRCADLTPVSRRSDTADDLGGFQLCRRGFKDRATPSAQVSILSQNRFDPLRIPSSPSAPGDVIVDELGRTLSEIQSRIGVREKKVEETRKMVEQIKVSAKREVKESEKSFLALIHCIEETCMKVTEKINKRKKQEMKKAEDLMLCLEKEIKELKSKEAALKELLQMDDNIHFLQTFSPFCVLPKEGDSLSFTITADFSSEDLRRKLPPLKEHLEKFSQWEVVSFTPPDFCSLTLDINTANRDLRLYEGNKKVTRERTETRYFKYPDRFDWWAQALCREALTGTRCYWEIQWSGENVEIGVSYKGMSRKGDGVYRFGFNDKSWSLLWSDSQYSVYHNSQQTVISGTYSPRIGVYLDWPAGSLSFYSVSHTMTLLHKFNTSFTEPLYPGFGLGWNTSVKICI
ncbi:TRI16 protein, partial [Polypterus senegalus]